MTKGLDSTQRRAIENSCEEITRWVNETKAALAQAAPRGSALPDMFASEAVLTARERIISVLDEAGIWYSALGAARGARMLAPDAEEFVRHVQYVLGAAK